MESPPWGVGGCSDQQHLGGPMDMLPFLSGVESQVAAESKGGELLEA